MRGALFHRPGLARVAGSVLAAAALLGACADGDDRPASWSYLSAAIVEPSCATASCHSGLTATQGVQLHTARAGYTFLVDGGFVVPGQPEQSKLVFLLRGEEVALRMPPDAPLPDPDIALIERWILEGAEDN